MEGEKEREEGEEGGRREGEGGKREKNLCFENYITPANCYLEEILYLLITPAPAVYA